MSQSERTSEALQHLEKIVPGAISMPSSELISKLDQQQRMDTLNAGFTNPLRPFIAHLATHESGFYDPDLVGAHEYLDSDNTFEHRLNRDAAWYLEVYKASGGACAGSDAAAAIRNGTATGAEMVLFLEEITALESFRRAVFLKDLIQRMQACL